METRSTRTTIAVCTMRLAVNRGSWADRLSSAVSSTSTGASLTEPSSDTPGKLPVGEALQVLQPSIYPMHERLRERLPLTDGREEGRSGGEVGDVMLAEIDEREAQGERVGPADGALPLSGPGQLVGDDKRGGEMERRHRRPRVAAQGAVHARPGGAPEVLAHLLHDPPHLLARQALP